MTFRSRLIHLALGVLCAQAGPVAIAADAPLAHSAAGQALLQIYYDGDYVKVGHDGLELLLTEPWDHELRLIVANSLAWTGYGNDAAIQYEALAGTAYAKEAALGLANVKRWNGRSDRAAPLYQQVLNTEPDNKDAQEGLTLASRELRPKTTVRLGHPTDSSDTSRNSASLSHSWRDSAGVQIFELGVSAIKDERRNLQVTQRDMTFGYTHLDAPLAPQIELSAQQAPTTRLFGAVKLKVMDAPAYVSLGHINWGKLAFDPNALSSNLTANHLGAHASLPSPIGQWRLAYNSYYISDNNVIQDARMQYVPAWQPFGTPDIKAFLGFEGRKARRNDPRYWSPENGNYNALVGVNAEWVNTVWQRYLSAQYGFPIGGNSANTWSVSAGIKRWLNADWAVGLDLWAMDTPRSGGYKAKSVSLHVERLW